MASVTGSTVVCIPVLFPVLIVHIGFVMLMADNAAENLIIRWIRVTLGTGVPLTFVFSGIDGKVLGIMLGK